MSETFSQRRCPGVTAESDLVGNVGGELLGELDARIGMHAELAVPLAHHVDPLVEGAALRTGFQVHGIPV